MPNTSRYNWEQYDVETLLKDRPKKVKHAYYVCYNPDPRHIKRTVWHVRIFLDCDGYPIPYLIAYWASALTCQVTPGAEWAYPNFASMNAWGYAKIPDMIIDDRDWLQRLVGCCPEEFWESF